MMKPLRNNIIFQFLNDQDSNQGMFKETTSFGFEILSNHKDSAKSSRWALVTHLGPEVTDVVIGDYIYIEALKWTDYFKYENVKYWKTDIDQILLVSKDLPSTNM